MKIPSGQIIFIIIFAGFTLASALVFRFFLKEAPIQSSPVSFFVNAGVNQNSGYASVGLPSRLKIPAIHVDSAVIPVGLTSDGAMDVPKDPAEVAWFNLGFRPGENGSAVIAGHYGWENNTSAVFDNLHELRTGDKISVDDEKGIVTTFVVREIRVYRKNDAASDVFGSSDGKSHLNLITCTGAWNKEEETRSERLVVFSDKE